MQLSDDIPSDVIGSVPGKDIAIREGATIKDGRHFLGEVRGSPSFSFAVNAAVASSPRKTPTG